MVKKQRNSIQVRLTPVQIATLKATLGRVSAAAVGDEAKRRFSLNVGRAECRRVAALIKEEKGDEEQGNLRIRTGNRDIDVLRGLSQYFGRPQSDVLAFLLHRTLSEVVGGIPLPLRAERLGVTALEAHLQALARLPRKKAQPKREGARRATDPEQCKPT
ncbi:hypothetical protein [Cupriavidus sp. CuC1]|uniref:hypothetical protein n=1 Tax=Cupriavidus sp. CuC1 TaxID=3373131 RepID=UPI0037CD05E1